MKLFRFLCLSVCLSLYLTIADAGSQSRASGGVIGRALFDAGGSISGLFVQGIVADVQHHDIGLYDVTFLSPDQPDTNFNVIVSCQRPDIQIVLFNGSKSATGFRISATQLDGTTNAEAGGVEVTILR